MAVDLEAFDDDLNNRTLTLLGDTITYTPDGGEPVSFKALVDYGDNAEQMSGSKVIVGECAVEIPITQAPFRDPAAEILLPKRPGVIYEPKNIMLDESGMNWLIVLKQKAV